MQIIICCVSLIIISLFIPKRFFKVYILISAIVLPCLYFFIEPSNEYDLSRHYEMFELVRNYKFADLTSTGNYALTMYFEEYKAYIILLWVISRLNIRELLPVLTGVVVYWLEFSLTSKILKKYSAEKWKYVLGYSLCVLLTDFLAISGIRNMLAVVACTYFIYMDVVEKKNRILCWVMYLLCASIHPVCVVYIAMRLCLIIINRYTGLLIKLGIVFGFTVVPFIYPYIEEVINGIPILNEAMRLFFNYSLRTDTVIIKSTFYSNLLLYAMMGIVLIVYHKIVKEEKNKMFEYTVISLLFTIGSINQYDIFVRYRMAVVPLILIYVLEVVCVIGGKNIFSMKKEKASIVGLYIAGMLSVISISAIYFFFLATTNYIPLTTLF